MPIRPEPDIAGGILRPTGMAEAAAYDLFLTSVRAGFDWGEQLAAQLGLAQQAVCPPAK